MKKQMDLVKSKKRITEKFVTLCRNFIKSLIDHAKRPAKWEATLRSFINTEQTDVPDSLHSKGTVAPSPVARKYKYPLPRLVRATRHAGSPGCPPDKPRYRSRRPRFQTRPVRRAAVPPSRPASPTSDR